MRPAGRAWEEKAWDLLLQHLPVADRRRQIESVRADSLQGTFSPDHLWIALRDRLLAGVLLQIPQPGRIAYVWPPVVASSESGRSSEVVADALLQTTGRHADALGIQFCQVTLAEGESQPPPCLPRNGYSLQTTLLLQERELDPDSRVTSATELVFESFQASQSERLAHLLKRTYTGTADCPAVTRWRSSSDALARHLATGPATSRNWTFLRSDKEDIGVLLLLEEEREATWEIDYFGVIPAARGRGYGRQAISWGLNFARERGGHRMQAIVDSGNHYACKTYAECGFRVISQRLVLLRMHPQLEASSADKFSTAKKDHD